MTLTELKRKLIFHNLPFHTWGQNGGKTLKELHEEILTGDSRLIESEGRLSRRIECAVIDVFHYTETGQRLYLKEAHQVVNGRYRKRVRHWSVYEKKRPGEDPLACARRALSEELDITEKLPLHSVPVKYDERKSHSFTGLLCSYAFYPFDVYLPEGWYKPEGYIDTSEAPHEVTYFKWA